MTTSDEEFASCEKGDRLLALILGGDLQQATLRLVVLGAAICAVVALISGPIN